MENIGIFLASGTTAVVGNTFLKAGMNQAKNLDLSLITNWQIILGFILYGVSSILYLKLLASADVTKAYPALVAYMAIVLLLLGSIFLKEALTLPKILGIIVIVLGIFLISR